MFSHNEEIAKSLGYYVDKNGKAFSPRGNNVGTCGKDGYMYFCILKRNGKDKKVYIHRLQAYQKYGDEIYQDGIVVRHLNNNQKDNSWQNIDIGTKRDNMLDLPLEKRREIAINAHKYSLEKRRKVTDEQVKEIVALRKRGYLLREIMKMYDLKLSTLENILHRGIVQQ